MSRRMVAVEQSSAAGMADTHSWQFETCKTTQELRMGIKYARKLLFFYVAVQYTRPQNRYGLVGAVMINPPELPINDEAWMILILQAQVCIYINPYPRLSHQKTKRETSDASKSKSNQASWNGTVLNVGSKNQSDDHNYLSVFFMVFYW